MINSDGHSWKLMEIGHRPHNFSRQHLMLQGPEKPAKDKTETEEVNQDNQIGEQSVGHDEVCHDLTRRARPNNR